MPEFTNERRQRLRTLRMMVPGGSWQGELEERYSTRFCVQSAGRKLVKAYDRDHAVYIAELHNELPDLLDTLEAADAEVAALCLALEGLLAGDADEQAWRAAHAALEDRSGSELLRRHAEIQRQLREHEETQRLLAGLSDQQRGDLVQLASDVDTLRTKARRLENRVRGLDKAQNELKRQRGELVATLRQCEQALHGLPGSGSLLWTQIHEAEKRATETLAKAEVVYGA